MNQLPPGPWRYVPSPYRKGCGELTAANGQFVMPAVLPREVAQLFIRAEREADETPVDAEWLLAVGFAEFRASPDMPVDGYEMLDAFGQCVISVGYRGQLLVNRYEVEMDGEPTRGQVRKLGSALGIELKEPA